MADITVRKVKFEFPDELDDVLPGDDLVRETYLVAFSLTMPYLEPYLIRTYRAVVDDITDPELASDVREFIGQEAQHFQNHRRINEIIKAPARARHRREAAGGRGSPRRRLSPLQRREIASVQPDVCRRFRSDDLCDGDDDVRRGLVGCRAGSDRFGAWQQLWAWHAAEEIEHRTVAFGVYEHLEGNWAYRVAGSLRAQAHFQRAVDDMQRILLASQGAPAKHHVPPWLRNGRSRYLATFKPGYDPADLDVSPLVAMVLAPYTAA